MRRAAAVLLALLALPAAAQDDEREGYYYPPVGSEETFARDLAGQTPAANRAVRIGFVTQVTKQQFEQAYAPQFAMFAKGGDADELIIVALEDGVFDTLQRARAVMAQLSASARTTQFFLENNLADVATFYDMLKILGFETLTLSDGRDWSHRVVFE